MAKGARSGALPCRCVVDGDYGKATWARYELGALRPEVELTGRFERDETYVAVDGTMRGIDAARLDEAARQLRLQDREWHSEHSVESIYAASAAARSGFHFASRLRITCSSCRRFALVFG